MTSKKIVISGLTIETKNYGPKKGQYFGRIRFTGQQADINLKLNDNHIKKIFDICIGRLYEVAGEVSDELNSNIIESMPSHDLTESDK
jgi:hypothetical protein